MSTKKHTPKRNPLEDTLSASLPKKMKRSIQGRGHIVDRPTSQLLRYAIEHLEATNWKDVPFAALKPEQWSRLKKWVESTAHLDLAEALALLD